MAIGKKSTRKTRSTAPSSRRSTSSGSSSRNSTRNSYYADDFELEEDDEEDGNYEDAVIEEAEEVTRCLCGNDDLQLDPKDKYYKNEAVLGLFIQCEKCNVWQHGYCVGIYEDTPELKKYWCELCRPDLHHVSADGKSSKYLPMQPKKRNSSYEKKRSASASKRNSNSSEIDTSSNNNNISACLPNSADADSNSTDSKDPLDNSSEISPMGTRSSRSKRTTLNSNDAILEKVLKESAREYNRKHHQSEDDGAIDDDDIKFKEEKDIDPEDPQENPENKSTITGSKSDNATDPIDAVEVSQEDPSSDAVKKDINSKNQDTTIDTNSANTTATSHHPENTTIVTTDTTIDNGDDNEINKNNSDLNQLDSNSKPISTRSKSKSDNSFNSTNKNSEKEESVAPAAITVTKNLKVDHDEIEETLPSRRGRSQKKRVRRAAAVNSGFGSAEDTADASSSNEQPELTYTKKRSSNSSNGGKKKRQATSKSSRNGFSTTGANYSHGNNILDSDRPIEPRIPSSKITLHEMRKRITAISEFIYYVSSDMIDEQKNYKELMSSFSSGAASNGNSANSSIVTSDDDIEDDKFMQRFEKFFENSSSSTLVLIDELKNKIQSWEDNFGTWN